MLSFALAILFLISTPGPGVLTTAGVGAAFGFRPGLRYVTGLGIGNNLVSLAVVTGLAAFVFGLPGLRTTLVIASAAYLAYLAFRIAYSGSEIAFIKATAPPGVMNGIMLQFINPKAYVVATTLFSGFAFLSENPWAEAMIKFAIINLVWIPIHLVWLWAGVSVNRLALSQRTQRRINFAMAGALIVVALLAVFAPT